MSNFDASPSADANVSFDADLCETTTVYINPDGVIFGSGSDDSVNNMSPFVNGTIGSASLDSTAIANILTCARALTASYAIEFSDVDPGNADHIEILLTDDAPGKYGLPSSVLSSASLKCDGINPRGVGFVFLNVLADDTSAICDQLGFVLGVSSGLTQDDNCASVMNGDAACPDKSFLDADTGCLGGTCQCGGGTTQNTHQAMLAAYDPACS